LRCARARGEGAAHNEKSIFEYMAKAVRPIKTIAVIANASITSTLSPAAAYAVVVIPIE
jgi:hypothetical protein